VRVKRPCLAPVRVESATHHLGRKLGYRKSDRFPGRRERRKNRERLLDEPWEWSSEGFLQRVPTTT